MRRAGFPIIVAFLLYSIVFVSVSAFTLSAEQEADVQLGAFDEHTYLSLTSGTVPAGLTARVRAAIHEQAPGSRLTLTSTTIKPDAFTKSFVQAPLSVVSYAEAGDLRAASPSRYRLIRGTWPSRPDDVVVSQQVLDQVGDERTFTVLSGRATFRVVGVVRDAYATRSDVIIAGDGTWDSLPSALPGHEAQPTDAQLQLYFGRGQLDQVSAALSKALPTSVAGPDLASILADSHTTRTEVLDEPVASFGSDRHLVSRLPLAGIVMLVAMLVAASERARQRYVVEKLVALGIRRRFVQSSRAVAVSVVCLTGALLGVIAGWCAGVVLRNSALPLVAEQPLSPVARPDALELVVIGAAVSIVAVGAFWPVESSRRVIAPRNRSVDVAWVRRAAIVLLVISAVQFGVSNNAFVAPYLVVAAAVLLAVEAVGIVTLLLARSGPRAWLAGRLMSAEPGRVAAAVVVVGCCFAVPLSLTGQLASKKVSDASFTFSRIPPGQLWVTSDNGIGDVPAVAKIVQRTPSIGKAIPIRGLVDNDGAQTAYLGTTGRGYANLNILVLETADQAKRLYGSYLNADAQQVLVAGGILDATSAVGAQRLVEPGGKRAITPELPTAKIRVPKPFQTRGGGVILRSTAESFHLQVSRRPLSYAFPNVTKPEIQTAVQSVVDRRYDAEFVQYNVPPPSPRLPLDAYVFLVCIVFGALAVMFVVLRGLASRLRAYTERLVAMGMTPRWVRSVLGVQSAVVSGIALAAGALAGLLSVRVMAAIYPVVSIPVLPIVLLGVALTLIAGAATVIATRSLFEAGGRHWV